MSGSPTLRVSVVIPCFNYGCYVERAVRSAWAQDFKQFELIAVDDGSTDDSLAVLRRLEAESPVPMRVLQGQHRGVAAAMNLGLEAARGQWLSILHADDYYREDKLSKQLALADDPNVTLVHSEYVSVDEDDRRIGYDSSNDLPPARGDALRELLELRADVRSMTMLMRTETLRAAGGYDEACSVEDWQSILRLAKRGLVAHVPEPLVYRRVHGASLSFSAFRSARFSFNEVCLHVLREVIPKDMDAQAVCARHSAVAIRHAVARGALPKAADALRQCWAEFPKARRFLVIELARGTRSLVWLRALRPFLPAPVLAQVLALKRRLPKHLL